MKKIVDLNNALENLYNKTGTIRCSYFSVFEPHFEDLIQEFFRCLSFLIKRNYSKHEIISLFYSILSHLTNEYLLVDVSKAKQFFDESLLLLNDKISDLELELEEICFQDVVSQSCKYFVKLVELSRENHEIFVDIIKQTESAYLPVFLRQHIGIKVVGDKGDTASSVTGNDSLELKHLKDAINNLEKQIETNPSNDLVSFSVVTVNEAAQSEMSAGRIADRCWDRVVFGKENGTVIVGDFSGNFSSLFGHSMMVTSVQFTSQSDQILTSSLDGSIKVWNEETHASIETYSDNAFAIWDIAANPRIDACFASGSMDGSVCLWDAHRQNPVRKMIGHLGSIKAVHFYKSGNYLLSGGDEGHLRLWDIRMGSCVRLWEATDGCKGIEAVAFSETGNEVVCGTESGLVEWMAIEGGTTRVPLHLDEAISHVVCHQKDQMIVSTMNGCLYLLDQAGLVLRQCDNLFSRIINVQKQSDHGNQALILREYE